ncbi:MAG: adenylate/guanylate cyclase domain-containing protein [Solirubrobacteraceae bacterium]
MGAAVNVSPICSACGGQNQADARFCSACGAALAPTTAVEGEARKTVTVLFADVVGSTVLGHDLDPESLRHVMSRYFEAMQLVLERHGGTVDKFIGDAVLAVFGVPRVHEDDALRAVRAAADMSDALAVLNERLEGTWGVALSMRVGINTGEVLVGNRSRGQEVMIGDAVNVAARLEQTAQPGQILIGDATYRLVRDAVSATAVGPLSLKGKPESLAAWLLAEVFPDASGFARRLGSQLVGRDRELAQLEERFARMTPAGSCEVITILGPAGVGKSRLVQELVSRLDGRATVVRGRCLSYGEGLTFWPVAGVLRDAAGIGDRDRPEEARRKVSDLLAAESEAALIADRLAPLVGADPARPSIQETFWAVRKLFEHLSRHRPLVVVFDDIHWGEATFHDLLEYLVDWIRTKPVLFLCLARPELLEVRPGWMTAKPNATPIALAPLTESETDGLISNLLDGAELASDARTRIAEVAEGNPLYVEQTLRMFVDDGLLKSLAGKWVVVGDLSDTVIPPTIQGLLAARLDRLDPEERAVIERASVIGRVFWWGALSELSPAEVRPRVILHVQSLTRKALIEPDRSSEIGPEAASRFAHILIRDAAYNGIPKGDRAELHERLADWLELHASALIGEYEEILGYHLEQAIRLLRELAPANERTAALGRRAATILGSAGRRAYDRGDMPAAVNLLSRAASLLPKQARERAELLPQLAFALFETARSHRDLERLQEVVDETTETAVACGAPDLEAYAVILGLWIRLSWNPEGWADEAQREAAEAISAFEAAGDERGLAKAWALLGLVHIERAQFGAAEDAWERAAAHAHRVGDRRDELESLSWVPLAVWAGPTHVDKGLRRCGEVFERAEGDKKVVASALGAKALFEGGLGRFPEARALLGHAKALLQEVALTSWLAGPLAQLSGWIELLAGDPVAAERELRWGYNTLKEIEERSWLSTVAAILAEAVYAQGRNGEAEHLARASEESAGAADTYSHSVVRSVRAKALARKGDTDDAERLARESVALADLTDFSHLRWYARMSHVEVLRQAGRGQDARPVLHEAIRIAGQKGNLVEEQRARDLLEDPEEAEVTPHAAGASRTRRARGWRSGRDRAG